MNGTDEVATDTANEGNNWTVIYRNLAKYDSRGNTISYTLDEEEITSGDLKFYTKGISSNMNKVDDTHYTLNLSNTFTKPNDLVQKTVTKIWDDEANSNNNRLSSIKLVLTGEGQEYEQVLTSSNVDPTNSNNWTYTFTTLPKYNTNGQEIKYILTEKKDVTTQGNGSTASTSNPLDAYIQNIEGFNVTNKLIIKETSIEKTGSEELTSLDGTINYLVNYKAKLDKGYEEDVTFTIIDTIPYEIDTSKTYNLNGGKYNAESKTIEWKASYNPSTNKVIYKKWEDNIWKTDKEEYLETTGETETTNLIQLSKELSLVYKNLPVNVPNDKLTNTVKGKIELSNNVAEEKETTFETNVNFKRNITVQKIWEGDTKEVGGVNTILSIRPTALTIELKTNGNVEQTEDLTTTNSWKTTFTNLPKYDSTTRQEISYTVEEQTTPQGYYTEIEQTSEQDENNLHFTITNKKFGSIQITKKDENTGAKLSGAEFTLTKINKDGTIDTTFNMETKTTSSEEANLGVIQFTNLKYGKYRLQEIKAPEGYNLLRNVAEIEITNEIPDYQAEITNREKTILPNTGGASNIIIIITGLAFLYVAYKLTHKKKRAIRVRDEYRK